MSTNWKETLEKARAGRDLSVFDIVSIDDLADDDIALIFELANIFRKSGSAKIPLLSGKTVINLFYENSTRTRASFELAGKHLGADVTNISAVGSSVKKGESLLDTAQTLAALQPSALVIRIAESGVLKPLCKEVSPAILNAGDGGNEHPSQALLDTRTMLDEFGGLEGRTVTIVGDVSHSRVFGSLVKILPRLGAEIRVSCPEIFLPESIDSLPVKHFETVEDALLGSDAVYALRVQTERGKSADFGSMKEYAQKYCMTADRFAKAKDTAILMHAGPVVRNRDIADGLMDHERNRVLRQVENGLAVRKALLWLACDRKDGKQKS